MNALVTDCMNYLELEQSYVDQLLQVVQGMREAMLSRDDERINKMTASMREINYQQLNQRRLQFRTMLSRALRIPVEQVRIRHVARQCDAETTTQLLARCEQLKQSTREVGALATANGNLAFQLWEVIERAFCALGGDREAPIVYESTGHRRVA